MARHLLVVLLEGASRKELERAVVSPDEDEAVVYIVAPRKVGPLEWLATDEARAEGQAAARVLEAEWLLAGLAEVGGDAGDSDTVLAVTDALDHFAADEIVVVGRGEVDPALVAALEALGPPLVLVGVSVAPASLRARLRGLGHELRSGRSAGTPFVALIAANVGLLVIALLGSLLVVLVVWLVGEL